MSKKPRTIKSVENALEIIHMLKEQKQATGKEIANQIGLSKGTIHTYLVTLQQEGYIEKTVDRKYRLGFEFIDLGLSLRENRHIYKYGKSEVDKLAQETGSVVGLSIKSQGVVRKIYTRRNPFTSIGSSPGRVLPIHASAAGKMVLANSTDERVDEIIDKTGLPQLTPHTITDRETLFEELATIREQGYADNVEEQVLGVRSLVIDVQRPDGTLAGTVAITGTASRFESEDREKLIGKLREAANKIEYNIQEGLNGSV
jgi:DNA-binding IclR family transcriptional regulator